MKIFLMITSSGSYEDYYETIKGAYLNRENCKKAITEYNDDLHYRQTMCRAIGKFCEEAYNELYYKFTSKDDYIYENKEFLNLVKNKSKDLPQPYDNLTDEQIKDIALNWYDVFEEDEARLREIEVLDVEE